MPITLVNRDKTKLWNSVVKVKKLTRVSQAHGVILPKGWLQTLEWDMQTKIRIILDPFHERISIETHEKNINPETEHD